MIHSRKILTAFSVSLLVFGCFSVSIVHAATACTDPDSTTQCGASEYCDPTTLTCLPLSSAPNYVAPSGASAANPFGTTNNSNTSNTNSGVLQNPLNATSLGALLLEVLAYVSYLGAIVLVIMLVWVGLQFVLARGNPEAVGKARSALLWTVIGGLVLLGASAIAIVIVSTVASL